MSESTERGANTQATKQSRQAVGRRLPPYLTPQEIGEMLGVHPRTVLRWAVEDASMPVTRLGRRVIRFEREAFLRWLARKRPRIAQRSAQEGSSASQLRVPSAVNS